MKSNNLHLVLATFMAFAPFSLSSSFAQGTGNRDVSETSANNHSMGNRVNTEAAGVANRDGANSDTTSTDTTTITNPLAQQQAQQTVTDQTRSAGMSTFWWALLTLAVLSAISWGLTSHRRNSPRKDLRG